MGCYVLGVLIQLPFVDTPRYTGPIAQAMGGIGLSWIIGLAVTSAVYYWLARRAEVAAQRTAAPLNTSRPPQYPT
jgi:NCS1 family nucleobase:cation symporter-1